MASDRRFGLPHPLDAELSEGPASRRKAGLWETLRRALGAPIPVTPDPDPPHAGESTGTLRPPALPPPSPARPAPAPRRPEPVVPALPLAPLPAEEVPFLEDPVPAVQPLSEAATTPSPPVSTPAADASPETPVPPAPPEPLARPSRLARGLASFSRDNAEREKKFAHLLRDEPNGPGRRADRPRKRG